MIPHLIRRCPLVPTDVRLQWLESLIVHRPPVASTRSDATHSEASDTEWGTAENKYVAIRPADAQATESQARHPAVSTHNDSTPVEASDMEVVEPQAPELGWHSQSQLKHLAVLRIKADVAKYKARAMETKYHAMAMEAEFMAEKMAARVKLQDMGIPEDEIDELVE
ncbi:hypothetical protein PHMEG_0005428 [Phytophthora megakarya]|uniref:Uncharacterized protein n=1 Tax=Phytophthora megakarya TaxID=4795 RepID=A0A225WRD2_9STRA|nr:hypothetical protein PHMEG_0005428 [Phytophthora megakarya]